MKNYANARDVLPKELFEEVKKHYTGMLYISDRMHPKDKRKLVIMLCEQKTDARDIASITGLSVRRVHQIIAQECRKNAFKGRAEGKMPSDGHVHEERAVTRSRAIANAIADVWEENERKQKPDSGTEFQ